MLSKILKYILNTVVYSFIGIAIIIMILFAFGIKPYITVSGSMEPNIQTGSVCFVNYNEKYENIKVNDIIAFKAGHTLVTHRVVNVADTYVETKGDNNEVIDTIKTNNKNFVGKTLFSIPYIGYVITFLQQPMGLSVIAAILILLIFVNIQENWKEKNKSTSAPKS